jgi:two-component system, chemotaxis family, sensor kinase CheA
VNAKDSDQSFILEALPAFISEAQEQIEALEQLLLQLEDQPDNRELLDALFRCAHTVKGSAGIFGLDRVVAFTHHVENLLDRLRDGQVQLSPELSTLLLLCNDQIRALVDEAQNPGSEGEDAARQRESLVERLQQAAGASAIAPAQGTAAAVAPAAARRWRLHVRFGVDTFRNGMDPLSILAYLRGLGTLVDTVCDIAAVPRLEALDPESCHLGIDALLDSEAPREQIEGAFSFVREDIELELVEVEAQQREAVARIEAMPDSSRLGDILVSAGAISRPRLQQGLQTQASASRQGDATPLGEILQAHSDVGEKVLSAALRKQQKLRDSGGATPTDDQRFIRVQADRLDAVMNLLGELVIASAGATALARASRQASQLEANQQIGALVEEIRNSTLQLRMVPIGETFSRFRRVVRDTAAELHKDVALEIVGGDTELDKSVVERIADPLMHLVRNALDHGLETAAQREAAGKPRQGRLTLAACHESGSILMRISDDGRGIDRQKVLERAWERGLVERGTVPEDEQILNLIFEPGFSTAEKVTNLSGRGVGMDVVRRNIEALRGSVMIGSVAGQGSTIEIRLPLTLAIIDGFLVGVGSSKFIFPLDAVVEVIESRPTATGLDAAGRGRVELRGQVLPVVSLRALYALDSPVPERSSVVVIRSGGRRFGVMVDQLLGQHQTVIKPLGRMFRSLRGMSGSSILGNGEVALIFDVNSLSHLAEKPPGTPGRQPTHRAHTTADLS